MMRYDTRYTICKIRFSIHDTIHDLSWTSFISHLGAFPSSSFQDYSLLFILLHLTKNLEFSKYFILIISSFPDQMMFLFSACLYIFSEQEICSKIVENHVTINEACIQYHESFFIIFFFSSIFLQALQEQYGPEGVGQQGMRLLLATLSKIYDLLLSSYEGTVAWYWEICL